MARAARAGIFSAGVLSAAILFGGVLLLPRPATAADAVANPITTTSGSSKAFVVTDSPDTVLYPTTTARDSYRDAMTADFKADYASGGPLVSELPRIHSWLGGLLWGTNKLNDNFWIPGTGSPPSDWVNTNVQTQGPLFTDLLVASYIQNPNLNGVPPINSNFSKGETGINFSRLYPYLAQNTSWDADVIAAMPTAKGTYWQGHAPLGTFANPLFDDVKVVPANTAPAVSGSGKIVNTVADVSFYPVNILVDRQGDFDVDFVYQNDADPYVRSSLIDPGVGQYLKYTVSQASPFIWVEANKVPVAVLRDIVAPSGGSITTGVLAPKPIPSQPNISVAILYANVDDPGPAQPANPKGMQDNWRFWAVYFDNSKATFVNYLDSETSSPSGAKADASWNSFLQFDDPNDKNFFVLAALPIERSYSTTRITTAPTAQAQDYAVALGPFAFNFPTDSAIDYEIVNHNQVETTFSATVEAVYGNSQVGTIFTLPRHQYEKMSLGQNPTSGDEIFVEPLVTSPSVIPFNPSDAGPGLANPWAAKYWSIRGSSKAIAVEPEAQASAAYTTRYPFNNFLHALPFLGGDTDFMSTTRFDNSLSGVDVTAMNSINSNNLGGFITATMDRDFVTNASNAVSNGAWGFNFDNAIGSFYSNQYLMIGLAQDLSLIHSLYQTYGASVPSGFADATSQRWIGGPPPPFTNSQLPSNSTVKALNTSVSQLQKGLQNWFGSATPPTSTQGALSLQNFLYYDPLGMTVLYPQNSACAGGLNFPNGGNKVNTISGCDPTGIFEAFGTATKFTDGAYGMGGWVTAAALTAIYENAALTKPKASNWAKSANYGAAIDLAVMGLAYDPNVDWYPDDTTFKFSKMPYFDQFSGHSWTTGILGTAPIFQGGNGHNENSITESGQALASIILWGMATGRSDVTELGIYLYTTQSFAADAYFFDKTNAYKPVAMNSDRNAAGNFLPLATAAFTGNLTNPADYPAGAAMSEFIASGSAGPSSGNSSINNMDVVAIPVATLFGGYPQAHAFITAATGFPWMLASGRNAEFWYNWNAAYDNDNYRAWADWSLIKSGGGSDVYNFGFAAMMLVNQAMGGYGTSSDPGGQTAVVPYPGPAKKSSTGVTPLQYYLDMMTLNNTGTFRPPFDTLFNASNSSPLLSNDLGTKAQFTADAIPVAVNYSNSHTVASMTNLLWTLEHLGPPDWTLVGRPKNSDDPYVFTAAFSKRDVSGTPGTTAVAACMMVFNPNVTPVTVSFYRVGDPTTAIETFKKVPAKQWAVKNCPAPTPKEKGSVCTATPQPDCYPAAKRGATKLWIRDATWNKKDRIVWNWRGMGTGIEDFGDPMTEDSLALCLYDRSRGVPEALTLAADAPAGGSCKGGDCWQSFGQKILRYRDPYSSPDGLFQILLYGGLQKYTIISVHGRGKNLDLPDLPLAVPILAQLQSSNNNCWEADFPRSLVTFSSKRRFVGRGE